MSTKLNRLMALMIAFFVAFGMIVAGAVEAGAESDDTQVLVYGQNGTNKIYVGEEGLVGVVTSETDENVPIKGVTVSNKNIAKVKKIIEKFEGEKYTYYYVVGKKTGKVTVRIKYKLNGVTSTKKVKVTVKKAPKMIKSLKVNGKKVKLSGTKAFKYRVKCKKSKTKVNVKIVPAEGWKVLAAYGDKSYEKNNKYHSVPIANMKKKIKNGSNISFAKKYTALLVDVVLQKDGGNTIRYTVEFYR